jgi:hypothetical protein
MFRSPLLRYTFYAMPTCVTALAWVSLRADKPIEIGTLPLNKYNDYVIFKFHGQQAIVSKKYRFSLVEPASLEVVRFEDAGEQYSIYDNGILLGTTGKVNVKHNVLVATPQDAIKDGRFLKGIYKLVKGSHKITFRVSTAYMSKVQLQFVC